MQNATCRIELPQNPCAPPNVVIAEAQDLPSPGRRWHGEAVTDVGVQAVHCASHPPSASLRSAASPQGKPRVQRTMVVRRRGRPQKSNHPRSGSLSQSLITYHAKTVGALAQQGGIAIF